MKIALSLLTALTCFTGTAAFAANVVTPDDCVVTAQNINGGFYDKTNVLKPTVLKSEDETRYVYSSEGQGVAFLMFFDGKAKVSIESFSKDDEIPKSLSSSVDPKNFQISMTLHEREWNIHCSSKK